MQKSDIEKKIADIETAMGAPDFWVDSVKAQQVMKEYQDLKAALAGAAGYDKGDAIVSVVSGAGGDDAEDFSRMLFSMYQKYAASRGWKAGLIDANENSMG